MALDHDLRVRRHLGVDGLAREELDRPAGQRAGHAELLLRVGNLGLRSEIDERPGPEHDGHAEALAPILRLQRGAPDPALRRHVHAEAARPLELHALQADAEDAGLRIATEHHPGRQIAAGVELGVDDDRQRRAIDLLAGEDDLLARAARHQLGRDGTGHGRTVAVDDLADGTAERDGQARHRAVETGGELPAPMPADVLEEEGRPAGVGRLAHVGRHLELRTDGLVDANELAGPPESLQIRAEVRHAPILHRLAALDFWAPFP